MRSMALSGRNRSVIPLRQQHRSAADALRDGHPVVRLIVVGNALEDLQRSSMLGSAVTGWKRRSSAVSFSIYLRYSLKVVAPMT